MQLRSFFVLPLKKYRLYAILILIKHFGGDGCGVPASSYHHDLSAADSACDVRVPADMQPVREPQKAVRARQ